MEPGDWIAAVSAGATVVAVLVALFGPALERRWRRPRLVLLAQPPPEVGGEAKVVSQVYPDGTHVFWLRLAVTNQGRTTADEVRLMLYRVVLEPPMASQLPAREAKWADVPSDHVTLPPAVTRLVDVLHVVRTTDRDGKVRFGWVTGAAVFPGDDTLPDGNLWRELHAGDLRLHVGLSARDVPVSRYEITMRLRAPDVFVENEVALRQAVVSVKGV